jgi:hypothetical protein
MWIDKTTLRCRRAILRLRITRPSVSRRLVVDGEFVASISVGGGSSRVGGGFSSTSGRPCSSSAPASSSLGRVGRSVLPGVSQAQALCSSVLRHDAALGAQRLLSGSQRLLGNGLWSASSSAAASSRSSSSASAAAGSSSISSPAETTFHYGDHRSCFRGQ